MRFKLCTMVDGQPQVIAESERLFKLLPPPGEWFIRDTRLLCSLTPAEFRLAVRFAMDLDCDCRICKPKPGDEAPRAFEASPLAQENSEAETEVKECHTS